MSDTYTRHAAVCEKFYRLTVDASAVGDFLCRVTHAMNGEIVLFVGGMFDVAAAVLERGTVLTAVDYSEEMTDIGRKRLPGARVLTADLRSLPFTKEFDLLLVPGRVFTHMLSDDDLHLAFESCRKSLKPGGRLFADNYESSKIRQTKYFNGRLECIDDEARIVRQSTTEPVSETPYVVSWNAEYHGVFRGEEFHFEDRMEHRAFSREEFKAALENSGLEVFSQGDNFDETSFYTVAGRSIKDT